MSFDNINITKIIPPGHLMCLYCGAICSVEIAAERRHTCRPVGALGPYLAPNWRPVKG